MRQEQFDQVENASHGPHAMQLSLFDSVAFDSSASGPAASDEKPVQRGRAPVEPIAAVQGSLIGTTIGTTTGAKTGANDANMAMSEADRHMQAAWRLSNALRGRSPAAAKVRRLKPRQKHQLGSIICSHLLASLRAQADVERQQQVPH